MKLSINRELLLKAINLVVKASDKRNNMVILGNIKLELTDTHLTLTGSDLEVEITTKLTLPQGACIASGATTLPADKFRDICKLLPTNSQINLNVGNNSRCLITSDSSKFALGTLPATDYPSLGTPNNITGLSIARSQLSEMIGKTQFAMAIQDVRYYLTGMLFDVSERLLTTVATDGHRLAIAKRSVDVADDLTMQAILPRKGVGELERLLSEQAKIQGNQDTQVLLKFGREFLQLELAFGNKDGAGIIKDDVMLTFTARLIDGKFPDYRRVMPSAIDKQAILNRNHMSDLLRRVSILSNEKSRGVVFNFAQDGMIEVKANNAEQDEATERLESRYTGDAIELSFNAQYLQDVLDVLEGDVVLKMGQANASALVNQHGDELHQYVIMPMRI